MKEEKKQLSDRDEKNPQLETTKKTPAKSGWVRLKEEKRFGSVTGSGFRVWGEE